MVPWILPVVEGRLGYGLAVGTLEGVHQGLGRTASGSAVMDSGGVGVNHCVSVGCGQFVELYAPHPLVALLAFIAVQIGGGRLSLRGCIGIVGAVQGLQLVHETGYHSCRSRPLHPTSVIEAHTFQAIVS